MKLLPLIFINLFVLLSDALGQTAQNIDGVWIEEDTHCYARQFPVGPVTRAILVCENQEEDWLYLFDGERFFDPDSASSHDTGVSLVGNIMFLPKGSRSLRRDNIELTIAPFFLNHRSPNGSISSTRTIQMRQRSGNIEINIPSVTPVPTHNGRHQYLYDERTKFNLREEMYPPIETEEDVTGVWYANDGGVYSIGQFGDTVVWFGEHPDGFWSNVGIGTRQGNQIELNWFDVPKGDSSGFGFLELELDTRSFLRRASAGAGFGGSTWRRNSDVRPVSLRMLGGQTDSEALCPHDFEASEDLEFAGNGPRVRITAELNIEPVNRTSLQAHITFDAEETGVGGSRVRGEWTETVYHAPAGRTIQRILSDTSSELDVVSPPGGFETPGENRTPHFQNNGFGFISDERVNSEPPTTGELVKFFSYVGDTGANDISTDETCIKETALQAVEFNPARIELAHRPTLSDPDIDLPDVRDPNDPQNRFRNPPDLRNDG